MRTHYLQHVPFEGLGFIEPCLRSLGHKEITSTKFFGQINFPNINDIDLLIVMGGPMSIHDEKKYPWLVDEKRFIRDVINSGKSVLGICLGAQLIANALGANVYQNQWKEIGWFPIKRIQSDNVLTFKFPQSLDVFHWHGETFNLPSGAIHLVKSEACENQAFQYGNSVIGLQFHLEITHKLGVKIIDHCRSELTPSRYVQTEETMLSTSSEKYTTANEFMRKIILFLTLPNDISISSEL